MYDNDTAVFYDEESSVLIRLDTVNALWLGEPIRKLPGTSVPKITTVNVLFTGQTTPAQIYVLTEKGADELRAAMHEYCTGKLPGKK